MARTIYKVEEGSPGKAPASPEPLAAVVEWQPTAPLKIKRRRLIYILAGIILLTIIMVVIIAALGASESPAEGTVMRSQTATTVTVPVPASEPVGTSTTVATVQEAAVTTAALPTAPSSTVSSAQSTSTTYYTNAITRPARIVIPVLGVDAPIQSVGLKNGSSMEVPAVGVVGWYKLGALPGGAGPSVLVSHVSWQGKKGAFYKIKQLKPGDQFEVYDVDGHVAVFAVDSSETILKADLPTEKIWNSTEQAVIRLVTCGGQYNSSTGHYLSNVIVYGHLVK